jgi:tetratricopeptide (TPR) repeat protein
LTVRPRLLTLLFLAFFTACAGGGTVTRAVDGRLVSGRYVDETAYAAYLAGAIHENRGDLDAAETAYAEAIRHDPRSAEIWTRIGAVRCTRRRLGRPGASAWDAFRRADEIDPEMEEVWTARARCHLDLGEIRPALDAARTAVALDPDRVEPAALLALVLERTGQIEEARRSMDGLVLRAPDSVEALSAMIDFAMRTGDRARRFAATEARAELRREGFAEPSATRHTATAGDLDESLLRGDLHLARELARSAGLGTGALALRAVAIGQTGFGREQAQMTSSADPSDSDARIAAAVAADLARDDEALSEAVTGLSASMTEPSPLGRALLVELVERRCVLHGAADRAAPADRSTADPLVVKVVDRNRSGARP